jgi:heme exporter protein D
VAKAKGNHAKVVWMAATITTMVSTANFVTGVLRILLLARIIAKYVLST